MSSLTESGEAERPDRSALWLSLVLVVAMLGSVWYYVTSRTLLDRIKARGVMRVITVNGPVTWYEGPEGQTGLEFDLASAFAEFLDVELLLIEAENLEELLPAATSGSADVAAGLAADGAAPAGVRYGPPYQEVRTLVIDKQGKPRIKSLDALVEVNPEAIAGSAHAMRLARLALELPELEWTEHRDLEVDELIARVADAQTDYAVVGSNQLTLLRHYHPELRELLEIGQPMHLRWAFRDDGDDSLVREAESFFRTITDDGRLTQLLERHYGHADEFNYSSTRLFMRRAATRLPRYRPLFEAAAEDQGLDWRLLAAISYQESHWRPNAVSPTGVRGMMMLTRRTAGQLEVKNRMDPGESIHGGARYFSALRSRIGEQVAEPDRTWMAMAAYNVGIGHLRDAQWLTEQDGEDPAKWVQVKSRLPLLSQKKWYTKLKHGYARGWEPVRYVQNIRRYFDILVWLSEKEAREGPGEPGVLTSLDGDAEAATGSD